MHKTLDPQANRILIACECVALLLGLWATSGRIALACAIGAVAGSVAGVLQGRALRAAPGAFATTVTAMDVRRALIASRDGKLAISLGWVTAAVLVVPALYFRPILLAGVPWLTGYLAFMFGRDIIAYPALRNVHAAASHSPTDLLGPP